MKGQNKTTQTRQGKSVMWTVTHEEKSKVQSAECGEQSTKCETSGLEKKKLVKIFRKGF